MEKKDEYETKVTGMVSAEIYNDWVRATNRHIDERREVQKCLDECRVANRKLQKHLDRVTSELRSRKTIDMMTAFESVIWACLCIIAGAVVTSIAIKFK